jgi:hypothetical protein
VGANTVRRHIAKSTWAEIRTAHASGIPLRELARNMNIPEGTILSRAKREGWTRGIQNAKALAKREDASIVVTPVEAVATSIQQRGERHVERMAGVSERAVDHIEKLDKVARRTFGLRDDTALGGFSLNVLTWATAILRLASHKH